MTSSNVTTRMRTILRKMLNGWELERRGGDGLSGELTDGRRGGKSENVSRATMNALYLSGLIERVGEWGYAATQRGRQVIDQRLDRVP